MKNSIAVAVAALAVFSGGIFAAGAAETVRKNESRTVMLGETSLFEAANPIADFESLSPNIRVVRQGGKSLSVTGLQAGTAEVKAKDESGEVTAVWNVTVIDSLMSVVKALGRDLEDVPEVDISINNRKICLRGEISKVKNWELYRKVIAHYSSDVVDYVVFSPGKELIKSFTELLASSGFGVVDEASPDKPGTVELNYAAGTLTITGYFVNKKDMEVVEKLVKRQSWLTTEGAERKDGSVLCYLNLEVVDRLVDVGVVVVTLDKAAVDTFGNPSADGKVLDFNIVGRFAKIFNSNYDPQLLTSDFQSGGRYAHATLKSDINGVLQFMAENNMTLGRRSGHVTFNSNGGIDASGSGVGSYQKGGQMTMKLTGAITGSSTTVDYGFRVDVKGQLVNEDEVRLELDLESSQAPIPYNGEYLQEKITTKMPVSCNIGETVIISGSHDMSQTKSGPDGYAFLRYIPVINWFAAGSRNDSQDYYTLILVSPQYADEPEPLRKAPSEETRDIERKVNRPLAQEVKKHIEAQSNWWECFYFWRWFED